jgi:pyrroloquinoline quinone (PQQ) biosynthesis protein C
MDRSPLLAPEGALVNLFDRLDAVGRRWNVLDHPFYRRWSAGELTPRELARYSAQYRHAVVALADASAAAAEAADGPDRELLEEHAVEERDHVAVWDQFADATGAGRGGCALPESDGCASAWRGGSDLLERLVTLYAIESAQPEISRVKLEGLIEHYGFEEGPATEYFSLHSERDVEHAGQARVLLERMAQPRDTERLAKRAEAALRGNWRLLDGVEKH